MNHFTTAGFWSHYQQRPDKMQRLADKNFDLLKSNPQHPSLHLKKVGMFWSVRVGRRYGRLRRSEPKVSCGSGLDRTGTMTN